VLADTDKLIDRLNDCQERLRTAPARELDRRVPYLSSAEQWD